MSRKPRRASWFNMTSKQQDRAAFNTLDRAVKEVARDLGSNLQLPQEVTFRLVPASTLEKNTLAIASSRSMQFSSRIFTHYDGDFDLLRGLVGHEMSHVSDFWVGHPNSDMSDVERGLVSEGKAEVVGIEIGGRVYKDELCSDTSTTPRELADMIELPLPEYRQQMQGEVYALGAMLVETVLCGTEENIFEVHSRPDDYFMDTFLHLQGYKDAAA